MYGLAGSVDFIIRAFAGNSWGGRSTVRDLVVGRRCRSSVHVRWTRGSRRYRLSVNTAKCQTEVVLRAHDQSDA